MILGILKNFITMEDFHVDRERKFHPFGPHSARFGPVIPSHETA